MKSGLILCGAAIFGLLAAWALMIRMPGDSFRGSAAPLTEEENVVRHGLVADVQMLAGDIGERNLNKPDRLTAAADFVTQRFVQCGLAPERQPFNAAGKRCENIVAEVRGTTAEIVLVGAHYDTVPLSPGANDNGSGVAALLALARRFSGQTPGKTLRLVAFPNEEFGHPKADEMGSWVYAKACRARADRIPAMISLETIGYFSSRPGSQKYPFPGLGCFYPTSGDFIALVGNVRSRALVRRALSSFRRRAQIASAGTALPAAVPGISWSDHWSFWQHGYQAIMVTDTAPFRYPQYHKREDTPDKLDYDGMTRVVTGIGDVVADLLQ